MKVSCTVLKSSEQEDLNLKWKGLFSFGELSFQMAGLSEGPWH
jgi:hypothetical protein